MDGQRFASCVHTTSLSFSLRGSQDSQFTDEGTRPGEGAVEGAEPASQAPPGQHPFHSHMPHFNGYVILGQRAQRLNSRHC